MSRRSAAAKTARRASTVDLEAVHQAHDRLHKDDVAGAHELLHLALGLDNEAIVGQPVGHRSGFDAGFRRLCLQHGVRASFVLADRVDGEHVRLMSGGDADLSALVDRAVRAMA